MCFVIAAALAAVGYFVPHLLPFTEALLASIFGIFVALGIAILVIEGTSLTRLGRRNKIMERTARSIRSDAAYAISWDTLALGRWLGSILPEQVAVDEEINDIQDLNWESSVNPVLLKVFQRAQQVTTKDIDILDPIPEDDYKRTVFETRNFVNDIRKRLESNLDVHERLLELSEALEELEQILTICLWPMNIREEENRFHCLSQLGIASIEFHESLGRMHLRL